MAASRLVGWLRAYARVSAALPVVDECIKTYKVTIDKKTSDRTEREEEKISFCKTRKLYIDSIDPETDPAT